MSRLPRLRSTLLLLAAASVLPVLLLVLVLSYFLVDQEADRVRQAALDRNRTLLSAIDAQMQGHLATLRVLSVSPNLASGDLASFHAESKRILATQPEWRNVLLVDPVSGRQLTNMRFDYGAELPIDSDLEALKRAVETRTTMIGDIGTGPVSGFVGIPVRIPIIAEGEVRYVLECILQPGSFGKMMDAQRFPATWAAALADRNGVLIARLPYREPGARVSADFWNAIQRAREGWYRGRTLEGKDTWTAHKSSDLTGWTVGVAIPSEELSAAAYRAATFLVLGTLASLALALAFAYLLAQHIATPIMKLAAAARHLGRDTDSTSLTEVRNDPRVQEVHEVASALKDAAVGVEERETLRQREQEALRASDKAKDEFLAMLGHELRNPLSAIMASAQVLRLSKPGDEAALQAYAVIERQARQMSRLVEDLLDVSRLAMGKVTLRRDLIDLAALVEHVAQTWQQSGRTRRERLRLRLSSAWVDADRARVEQVLANLLDNAEKFSDGVGLINVEVRADGPMAVLEVSDQGQGIAEGDLSHIFDLFTQGTQSFHRPQGGIGLGLALVKRFVELHGGTVSAVSEGLQKGARFIVRFPLVAAPAPQQRPEQPVHDGEGHRILLVEDNDDSRAMMEVMLGLEGHSVRTAANGEQALSAATEWRPDIALIDIGLPTIDGYEVARRMRAMPDLGPVKLVAISGFGQPQDLRSAYEAGFDLHLTKPIAPEFLRDVIGAMVSRRTL